MLPLNSIFKKPIIAELMDEVKNNQIEHKVESLIIPTAKRKIKLGE